MASPTVMSLPPMAPFPEEEWRARIVPEEWAACLDAWVLLVEIHLSFSPADFQRVSVKDESVGNFLQSYLSQVALSPDIASSGESQIRRKLWKQCFLFSIRLFHVEHPPGLILRWGLLSDFCKVYGKTRATKAISGIWSSSQGALERDLTVVKSSLIGNLERGIQGNLKDLERDLKRLNYLVHSSPETAIFLMNGSDFLDGLVSCYKLMNPPLRKVIISTTYLSLLGLTEGPNPKFSLLVDQLYSLKAAADLHKAGPTSVNDSLVAELVTVTPILKQVQNSMKSNDIATSRANSIFSSLEGFRKAGGGGRPKRIIKRKINKGKKPASRNDEYDYDSGAEIHTHRMSLVTQVQDLFPDLGSGFVVKLLEEYNADVEQVISHLLEDSLPIQLRDADHGEILSQGEYVSGQIFPDLAPRSTPPLLPARYNVFDDDEFDQLTLDTSRLHFGRRDPDKTADDILNDRSTAPKKSAILSALATFDSDDDERDDTYDVEDVGGTVDSAAPGNNAEEENSDNSDPNEETLFRAFKMTPNVFDRDAATRRSQVRLALKEETGRTDEAIEGWALMLSRDPRRMRRLEAKFSTFSGAQKELGATAWRAETGGSGTEDSDGGRRAGRGASRGPLGPGGHRRGGSGRGGNVADPAGQKETDVARQRKEANKASRANHNRRDQRARKMARSGFPA